MNAEIEAAIHRLHDSGSSLVLAVTGGGASLAGWLLAVPGASRTVLEVVVPYHEEALVQYLGRRPESFCAAATSQAMARRALERARWLLPGKPIAGLACTASLRSDRPKHGPHRFHASVCHSGQNLTWSLTLTKDARSRLEEEEVVDRVTLQLLLQALKLDGAVMPALLAGEAIETDGKEDEDLLAALTRGERQAVLVEGDGRLTSSGPRPALLLPGSFNPLHHGHWQLAQVAARRLGTQLAFELAVVNADKPPLHEEEARCRLAQFGARAPLWLTRAPTFVEKARLFPGVVFAVGTDTAARIVQPRFYQDSEALMLAALAEIRRQGCRFLVAARLDPEGKLVCLDDLALPGAVRDLFEPIPPDEFRLDVSSTELRRLCPGTTPEQRG